MDVANSFTITRSNFAKVHHKRNIDTDRIFLLNESVFNIHGDFVMRNSPVLAKIMTEIDGECVCIDSLLSIQPCLSPKGVDLALDFIYGNNVIIKYEEIGDAMAAAHGLELNEMKEAVEEQIVQMADNPLTSLISLEHAVMGNLNEENGRNVVKSASQMLGDLVMSPSFSQLSVESFSILMEYCISDVLSTSISDVLSTSPSISPFYIVESAIQWAPFNQQHLDILMSLLEIVPMGIFTQIEVEFLISKAKQNEVGWIEQFIRHKSGEEHTTQGYNQLVDLSEHYEDGRIAAGKTPTDCGTNLSECSEEPVNNAQETHQIVHTTARVNESDVESVYSFPSSRSDSSSLIMDYRTPPFQTPYFDCDLGALSPTADGKYEIGVVFNAKDFKSIKEKVFNFDLDIVVGK